MNEVLLTVVIPTHRREVLLARTLESLIEAHLPERHFSVVVIENGDRAVAQLMVNQYADRLPIEYKFSGDANKSRALNQVLSDVPERAFLLFFDDDVRIHRGTVQAYLRAITDQKIRRYYGGKCLVDYEEPPPRWLRPYLPPSAVGWDLGDDETVLAPTCAKGMWPYAMGFNWGAFAGHLMEAGGFDETRGPGTQARGQETEMQARLAAMGVEGRYLPQAVVWHFIPKERCDPAWCLNRVREANIGTGRHHAREPWLKRTRRIIICWCKLRILVGFLRVTGAKLGEARAFHLRYRQNFYAGMLRGLLTKA